MSPSLYLFRRCGIGTFLLLAGLCIENSVSQVTDRVNVTARADGALRNSTVDDQKLERMVRLDAYRLNGLHTAATVAAKIPSLEAVLAADLGLKAINDGSQIFWISDTELFPRVHEEFEALRCFPMSMTQMLECELVGAQQLKTIPECASQEGVDSAAVTKNVIPIAMIRMLGNDMPPLHGQSQTAQNLQIILNYEDSPTFMDVTKVIKNGSETTHYVNASQWILGRKSPHRLTGKKAEGEPVENSIDYSLFLPRRCQRGIFPGHAAVRDTEGESLHFILNQFRVVNRIMDAEAYHNITSLLHAGTHEVRHESERRLPSWVWSVPSMEVPCTRHLLVTSWAPPIHLTNLNRARNWMMQETQALGAKWSMPLDGNVFVTREGYSGLAYAFARAELKGRKYLLHPFFRMENEYSGEALQSNPTLRSLADEVAMYEAQLSVKSGGPLDFPDDARYGYKDKYLLLLSLKPHDANNQTDMRECGEADIGYYKAMNITEDAPLIARCGYMLRMPYWPDLPRPEEYSSSMHVRYVVRLRSLMVLRLRLAEVDGLYDYLKAHGAKKQGTPKEFDSLLDMRLLREVT